MHIANKAADLISKVDELHMTELRFVVLRENENSVCMFEDLSILKEQNEDLLVATPKNIGDVKFESKKIKK